MITIDFIHMAALDVKWDQGQLTNLIRQHLEPVSHNNGISYVGKMRELKRLAASKSLTRLDTALQPFINEFYNSIVEMEPNVNTRVFYFSKYGFNASTSTPTLMLNPIAGY